MEVKQATYCALSLALILARYSTPAGSAMSPPPWALLMVPGKRSEATNKPFSTGASKDIPGLVHILRECPTGRNGKFQFYGLPSMTMLGLTSLREEFSRVQPIDSLCLENVFR